MRLDVDQPSHKVGCDGTEEYGPCQGCRWDQERLLDGLAWERWVMLFKWVPADTYRPQGMGQG